MKQKLDKLLRAHPPIRFVVDVVDVYFSKCVSRAAAELAYFLILTFFPIMICISAFVNELHLDLSSLMDHADPFLPEGVLVIFQDYLTYIDTNQSSTMLFTGAFLTILFASAAVRGLMNIMRELYGRATFRGVGQLAASILFSMEELRPSLSLCAKRYGSEIHNIKIAMKITVILRFIPGPLPQSG